VYIARAPLVLFGVKAKTGGATVTGKLYGYYNFLDTLNMKVTDTDQPLRDSEFDDGIVMLAGKEYQVLTNTTTLAGAASIVLKKDSKLTIPFSISKGDNKKSGNALFVDFAP
jgi:hypothetical protein